MTGLELRHLWYDGGIFFTHSTRWLATQKYEQCRLPCLRLRSYVTVEIAHIEDFVVIRKVLPACMNFNQSTSFLNSNKSIRQLCRGLFLPRVKRV